MEVSAGGDYAEVTLIIVRQAPRARGLHYASVQAGQKHHTIAFDYEAGEVWHAWSTAEADGLWRLDRDSAETAEGWMRPLLAPALDRLADPHQYAEHWDAERRRLNDLQVLHELQAVQLAALWSRAGELPHAERAAAVDRMICAAVDGSQAENDRLAMLRARNLLVAFGADDRAVAAAAKALRTSHQSVRLVLAARTEFAERLRSGTTAP